MNSAAGHVLRCISKCLLVIVPLLESCSSSSSEARRIPEPSLYGHALVRPLPEYPDADAKRGVAGVAVAQVHLDGKGNILSILVKEAPSPSLRYAVSEAISKWKFSPFDDTQNNIYFSNLTFYFVNRAGTAAQVYYAADAPYVGP